MYNGFRHVIGSILDNEKDPCRGAYALVMGAVYGKITAVKAFGVRFREAHGLDGPDPGPYKVGAGYLQGRSWMIRPPK